MSRGGSFDWSFAGVELYVGWRTRREFVLSSTDLIQEVWGTHKRQPSCLGSILVPSTVQGPAALAKRSPQRLPQWY